MKQKMHRFAHRATGGWENPMPLISPAGRRRTADTARDGRESLIVETGCEVRYLKSNSSAAFFPLTDRTLSPGRTPAFHAEEPC